MSTETRLLNVKREAFQALASVSTRVAAASCEFCRQARTIRRLGDNRIRKEHTSSGSYGKQGKHSTQNRGKAWSKAWFVRRRKEMIIESHKLVHDHCCDDRMMSSKIERFPPQTRPYGPHPQGSFALRQPVALRSTSSPNPEPRALCFATLPNPWVHGSMIYFVLVTNHNGFSGTMKRVLEASMQERILPFQAVGYSSSRAEQSIWTYCTSSIPPFKG